MSDNDSYLGTTRRTRLAADIGFLMVKGAGYALLAVLSLWLVFAVFVALAGLLPPESQEAADPTPWSFLILPEAAPAAGADRTHATPPADATRAL